MVSFQLHPLPKQLGQKHASDYPAIRQAILSLDAQSTAADLLAGRSLQVRVEERQIEVLPEEIEVRVEPQPGFSAAADGAYVAAVNTEVTQALERKGLARELVRRIEDLRKAGDFEVDARIDIQHSSNIDPRLAVSLKENRDYIMAETLGESLADLELPTGEVVAEDEIDGMAFKLAISRVK